MKRVADYLVERLYERGTTHVFMVTGRGILFLSDAVARHQEIRGVCVHHEQAAAFAAYAYTSSAQRPGACLVSTGCASTNTITGLLCAWQDDVPCVFVSGQNKLAQTSRHAGIALRTFGQQEADIVKLVEPLTKYATMISDPKEIAYELDKAFYLANSGRKGPVWIDVPLDIQNMRIEPDELRRFLPHQAPPPAPSHAEIEFVLDALKEAKRPTLLLGSGVRSSGAIEALESFLDKAPFPVTFSPSAVDIYGSSRPLSIGAVGSLGATRAGNFVVQNADLLLVIGCRLSPITTGEEFHKFAREAKIIVVDIDEVEHSKKTVSIDKLIVSDANAFLLSLEKEAIKPASEEWLQQCLHWKGVFPKCEDQFLSSEKVDLYHLGLCLSQQLNDQAIVITDAGLEELILPSTIDFKKGQRCIHPASQGTMGFALPAACGAHFASGQEVIVVVGDGSIMMNLQELQTIRSYNLPVKIFVINNNVYSVIRTRQVELFRRRTIGTDPSNGVSCPDFGQVAACFDIPYQKIEESKSLEEELRAVLDLDGPLLCEIMAVEDQIYIRNSYAHDSRRRVVRRPLEDQAPFMPRARFLSEMIIAPIDQ